MRAKTRQGEEKAVRETKGSERGKSQVSNRHDGCTATKLFCPPCPELILIGEGRPNKAGRVFWLLARSDVQSIYIRGSHPQPPLGFPVQYSDKQNSSLTSTSISITLVLYF